MGLGRRHECLDRDQHYRDQRMDFDVEDGAGQLGYRQCGG
jgi:hypothetical protein